MNASWQTHRPLLLPALALWGWQADLLLVALAMGVALEAPRLIRVRLDIAQADFDRLWSFTAVLFLAVIFYLALARQGLNAVGALTGAAAEPGEPDGMHRMSGTALTVIRWQPFILFPFTFVVAWSRTTVLPWSTISMYEQARAKRNPLAPVPEWATKLMHPGYFYLGVALFAATTVTVHAIIFLPLLLLTLLMALWPWRNRRYGIVTWAVVLMLLAGVSVAAPYGHRATRAAWAAMEARLQGAGVGNAGQTGNPDQISRNVTFGAIGTLKQSGAIILRATTPDDQAPGLLREASFNRFLGRQWDSGKRTFEQLDAGHVLPAPADTPRLTITRVTANGDAPLAVPGEASAVRLPSPAVGEAGGLGAIRVRGALPLVIYQIEPGWSPDRDGRPEPDDTRIDRMDAGEREALNTAATEIGLTPGMPVEDAMRRIEIWFGKHFLYSLYQARPRDDKGPLARFLGDSHAGHCEYFATTTVLLLRLAGVPARYAVGFSMNEKHGDTWIARGRDAHAWCLVWHDGRWHDFDTTPGSWREAEEAGRPWMEGLSDRWADFWHHFDLWRQQGGRWQLMVFIAGMVVLAWIAWRQLRGSRWRKARQTSDHATLVRLGLDSEFLTVLDLLAQGRHTQLPPAIDRDAWAEAQALHERLRFDPAGLVSAERERLRTLSLALIAVLKDQPPTSS